MHGQTQKHMHTDSPAHTHTSPWHRKHSSLIRISIFKSSKIHCVKENSIWYFIRLTDCQHKSNFRGIRYYWHVGKQEMLEL